VVPQLKGNDAKTTATFACLIPAFNESARIGGVLSAVLGHPLIATVLVVDDGSSDGTAAVARFHGARVLEMTRNGGKTAALAAGIAALETSHLVLIDADLRGLRPDHLTRLVAPVEDRRADVAISLRGNAPLTWRLIGADYISGERVVPRALLPPLLADLPRLPRFGFEVFLNEAILRERLTTAIVPWPDVASPSKAAKRGLVRGLRSDVAMLSDIFRTVPPYRVAAQIAAFAKAARWSRSVGTGWVPQYFDGT
jgi:glycosyltransferase involved in cell wall biosynthesis